MAVQMKMSVRSDFMISDAAMPQRMAQLDAERELQMAQFAKILGGFDSKDSAPSADVMSDIQRAVNDLQDNAKFEQALKALDEELHSRVQALETGSGDDGVYRSKSTGEPLPEDTAELAEMVVKGKLNIKDIPDGLMTSELMNAIIALMLQMRLRGKLDDEETPDTVEEELFDPAVAAVNEQNYSREISSQMLAELYGIIEKRGEDEDRVTFLDGISEPIDEDETLASVATEELHAEAKAEEGFFEEIVDSLTDEFDAAHIDGTPVIQTQTQAEPQTRSVQTVSETQNAVSQAATKELDVPVVAAAEESGQSDGTQTQLGGQAAQLSEQLQKAAEPTEASERAEFDSVIESFTVKDSGTVKDMATVGEEVVGLTARHEIPKAEEAPDITEVSETAAVPERAEQPKANAQSEPQSRVVNASEELEMLKNAKLTRAKDDGEESPAVNTAVPQISDQPVVFTRTDGTEIEVKPTEIIDQAMKIVEKAIEENKEQTEYSLVLNPEELGRITVKLIKAADGAVSVTIAAENAHTQRVLEQHSALMQSNLRENGVDLASWQTVNESRQETYAQDYNGSSKNPYFRRDEAQNDSDNNEGDRTFADIIAAM